MALEWWQMSNPVDICGLSQIHACRCPLQLVYHSNTSGVKTHTRPPANGDLKLGRASSKRSATRPDGDSFLSNSQFLQLPNRRATHRQQVEMSKLNLLLVTIP